MQNKKPVGISFDKDILMRIDIERGDISRSKYLLKILERIFITKNIHLNPVSSNQFQADLL